MTSSPRKGPRVHRSWADGVPLDDDDRRWWRCPGRRIPRLVDGAQNPRYPRNMQMVRPRSRLRLTLAAAVFGALALSPMVFPTEAVADPILQVGGGDVRVEAEKLEVDVSAQTAVLTGSVVLAKGDLAVRCPRLDLKFDHAPHLSWAKGSGGVAADVRGVHAEAPEVELDLTKQVLELRGGVKLSRGQGFLQAESATINIMTAKVTATQVKGQIPVPKAP